MLVIRVLGKHVLEIQEESLVAFSESGRGIPAKPFVRFLPTAVQVVKHTSA